MAEKKQRICGLHLACESRHFVTTASFRESGHCEHDENCELTSFGVIATAFEMESRLDYKREVVELDVEEHAREVVELDVEEHEREDSDLDVQEHEMQWGDVTNKYCSITNTNGPKKLCLIIAL